MGAAKPQVVLIADDLTGAADSGVMFARCGLTAMVVWDEGPAPNADVRVLSSESRERSQGEAVRRVTRLADRYIARERSAWIYKKIDSTLRGYPGVELAALMDAVGLTRALVAPAFPAEGRVTIGGVHRVHGVRLDKTVFGRAGVSADVAKPFVKAFGEESVASLPLRRVRCGVDVVARGLKGMTARVIIADAETPEDLDALALAADRSGIRLLCGSAGLAGAMGRSLDWRSRVPRPQLPDRRDGIILVVAASRHPSTAKQIEALKIEGVPVVTPSIAYFRAPKEWMDTVLDQMPVDASTVVLTMHGLPDLPGPGVALAGSLARASRAWMNSAEIAGMVLTGGDAAIAVATAFGARALWLRGEVRSGMPWGLWFGGVGNGLPVVTKAGGFGETDALIAAVDYLRTDVRHLD